MDDTKQSPLLAAEQVAEDELRLLRAKLISQFTELDSAGADVILLRVLGKRAGRLRYEADVLQKVVMDAYGLEEIKYHLLGSLDQRSPDSGYNPFLPFHFRKTREPAPRDSAPDFDGEFGSLEDWGIEPEVFVPISIYKLDDEHS